MNSTPGMNQTTSPSAMKGGRYICMRLKYPKTMVITSPKPAETMPSRAVERIARCSGRRGSSGGAFMIVESDIPVAAVGGTAHEGRRLHQTTSARRAVAVEEGGAAAVAAACVQDRGGAG